MKKIDHATATVDLEFTEGNPGTGTPATRVTAQWLNVLQAEIINVLLAAGVTPDQTGVNRSQLLASIQSLLPNNQAMVNIQGLTLSNNGADALHDIDFAAGAGLADDFSTLIVLPSALTKRFDAAFTAGNNGGGMDTGSMPASGTLHFFAIKNMTTGDVDILASTSLNPAMPTGFTKKRRIQGLKTNASSQFLPFFQRGDYIGYKRPITDVSNPTLSTASRTARTISVPSGVSVLANMRYAWNDNGATNPHMIIITGADEEDLAPAETANPLYTNRDDPNEVGQGEIERWTSTASQVYDRVNNATVGPGYYYLQTHGYHYPRSL